jgi:5'-deoxynucleotidase YfbR-like HD superfamily hydrolase
VKEFYSVAQHSVLVSYICDEADALWGLLHDATEAYLVDVPRPLKRSGKFDAYLEFEYKMQLAICKRFGLPEKEPSSVKKADAILLATEARDLMSPLRTDWVQPVDPLPFKIEPLDPRQAKDLFMKRFFELTGMKGAYEHYLHYENQK